MHVADFILPAMAGRALGMAAAPSRRWLRNRWSGADKQFEIGVVPAFLPSFGPCGSAGLVCRTVHIHSADDDSLGLRLIADKDPVAFLEIGLRIKIGIHLNLMSVTVRFRMRSRENTSK